MSALILLLTAPMQSWGARAAFTDRDTLPHPTRSGVIGLLANALGLTRDADLSWAQQVTIDVRADAPGRVMTDYHTIGGGYTRDRAMITADGSKRYSGGRGTATLTHRAYLADAAFTVAITSNDTDLIDRLQTAILAPKRPLFLGRKSCPPSLPVALGVTAATGPEALSVLPLYLPQQQPGAPDASEYVDAAQAAAGGQTLTTRTIYLDHVPPADAYTVIQDNPHSYDAAQRTYRTRHVGSDTIEAPAGGTGLRGWLSMHHALTPPTN